MPLIRAAAANYIPVRDLASATAWYIEKLALRKIEIEMDDSEGCIGLGFSKNEYAVTLGPLGKSSGELTSMLYASSLKKAHEFLTSRGVSTGEIQQDAQGTHYFTMRDFEGNEIEVTEEP